MFEECLEEIHWVTCEIIKECGYHDVHDVGDIISVNSKHLDEMMDKGYIRIVGSEN